MAPPQHKYKPSIFNDNRAQWLMDTDSLDKQTFRFLHQILQICGWVLLVTKNDKRLNEETLAHVDPLFQLEYMLSMYVSANRRTYQWFKETLTADILLCSFYIIHFTLVIGHTLGLAFNFLRLFKQNNTMMCEQPAGDTESCACSVEIGQGVQR